LNPEQRQTISAVRKIILRHLPRGYCETMNWGMISYEVPLKRYEKTYNGQPLSYAALAAQKDYCALYLMCHYSDPRHGNALEEAFKAAGKKLNMGKSCIRFREVHDLPLETIGRLIADVSVDDFIAQYEDSRGKRRARRREQKAER
jgi:hypothetical protein